MRHIAVFSFIAFFVSVGVYFVFDRHHDADLVRAQREQLEQAAFLARAGFIELANRIPGESEEEADFIAWLYRCIVPDPPETCGTSVPTTGG